MYLEDRVGDAVRHLTIERFSFLDDASWVLVRKTERVLEHLGRNELFGLAVAVDDE